MLVSRNVGKGPAVQPRDQASIVGPGDELVQAWDLVRKEADKVGMRLNVDKCEIWAWEGEEADGWTSSRKR